jgi:hypothetical protein
MSTHPAVRSESQKQPSPTTSTDPAVRDQKQPNPTAPTHPAVDSPGREICETAKSTAHLITRPWHTHRRVSGTVTSVYPAVNSPGREIPRNDQVHCSLPSFTSLLAGSELTRW